MTDALGRYGGHTAVAEVHPGGISIHTLMNCDPDGLFVVLFKLVKNWSKSGHAIVPFGHVRLSAPRDPVCPCSPGEPDTNKLGLIRAASSHAACVVFTPLFPANGVLPEKVANEAVTALTVDDKGTLAVVAVSANDIFCFEIASVPRNGK